MYLNVVHSPWRGVGGCLKFSGKDVPMVAPKSAIIANAAYLCINGMGVQKMVQKDGFGNNSMILGWK